MTVMTVARLNPICVLLLLKRIFPGSRLAQRRSDSLPSERISERGSSAPVPGERAPERGM